MNYDGSTELHRETSPLTTINNEFVVVGGVLLSYTGCDSILKIPEGIIAIGDEAFHDNLMVKEVYFSDSVVKVGKNAFKGCVELRKIYNYSKIKIFEEYCFQSTSLLEVVIGPNVEFLGKGCFSNIKTLEVVFYEVKIDLKLDKTFANCQNLNDVEDNNHRFFPSINKSLELRHNPDNTKPTWADAFYHTPYIKRIHKEYRALIKKGICPNCGCKLRKFLFFYLKKCKKCNINFHDLNRPLIVFIKL